MRRLQPQTSNQADSYFNAVSKGRGRGENHPRKPHVDRRIQEIEAVRSRYHREWAAFFRARAATVRSTHLPQAFQDVHRICRHVKYVRDRDDTGGQYIDEVIRIPPLIWTAGGDCEDLTILASGILHWALPPSARRHVVAAYAPSLAKPTHVFLTSTQHPGLILDLVPPRRVGYVEPYSGPNYELYR